MSTASDNLLQLDRCPTFYDHLPKIEAAMRESDRVYAARTAAGWELNEGGWYGPCDGVMLHERVWEDEGWLLPEDADNS